MKHLNKAEGRIDRNMKMKTIVRIFKVMKNDQASSEKLKQIKEIIVFSSCIDIKIFFIFIDQ